VVTEISAEFDDVEVIERSIVDEPELSALYAEEIPVVLINGAVHNMWRINPERLRAAIGKATQ
jgi:hypothetical protein